MNTEEIKKLKYNRSLPEEQFVLDIFDGLTKEESLVDKNSFLYVKDNYCYFYHNTESNYFWCDYDRIWEFFNSKFAYNNLKTNDFIKSMVEKHFKLKEITTFKGFINKEYITSKV